MKLLKKLFRLSPPSEAKPGDTSGALPPFNGKDNPAERKLANICQHSDLRFIFSYRFLRGEGLEIGALHFPLPVAPGVSVKYYDYCTREENIRRFPKIPADKIVNTDYVGDGEKIELIAPASLDFLIANHMLEHCQDVLGTLNLFFSKLRANGVLFISLPDLRYTFDCRRAPTPFEHLERDQREGPKVSLYSHYRDILGSWSPSQGAGVRDLNPASADPLDEPAFNQKTKGTHVDWHFHAWTQLEIIELFVELRRRHGIEFEIEAMGRNGIEFIAVLRKTTVEVYDRNEPSFRPLPSSSPA